MRDAVIVALARTAVGKAYKGTLANTRPDDMAAEVINHVLSRVPELDPKEIEDVVLGCAMPEAEQGMNVARIASLRAGLPISLSAMTINRFCASGLQSVAQSAERICIGGADVILAGGTETMSMIPMGGHKIVPNPYLVDNYPDAYLGMGLTAERLAVQYEVSREQQDEFSYQSHQKAIAAIEAGKFKDEIAPIKVKQDFINAKGKKEVKEVVFDTDEGPRKDTTIEALGKLKPAFKLSGTVTAGNSSQMSDGAAIVLLMSDQKAARLGLKPLARFVSFATGGVEPENMGIGPVVAIPKALKMAGLKLEDIDVIELNEAFAAQALSVIKAGGLDPAKVNVNGGAVALGHPLGCTGSKLIATTVYELKRRGGRYGMVTMCVGGGMGAAGIFEALN
jgi:acetyl-CoA acyltransferase